MATWKNINVNDNLIEKSTGKAVLIKMPKKSKYAGYTFWHPAKCVHEGRHSAAVSLGYTTDWKFSLKKTGKNFNVLDEAELTAEELEAEFATVDANIISKQR